MTLNPTITANELRFSSSCSHRAAFSASKTANTAKCRQCYILCELTELLFVVTASCHVCLLCPTLPAATWSRISPCGGSRAFFPSRATHTRCVPGRDGDSEIRVEPSLSALIAVARSEPPILHTRITNGNGATTSSPKEDKGIQSVLRSRQASRRTVVFLFIRALCQFWQKRLLFAAKTFLAPSLALALLPCLALSRSHLATAPDEAPVSNH